MKTDNSVTDRYKGPLTPQEADRLVAEYRRGAGIPVNTWEKQEPLAHPPIPPIMAAFHHESQAICPRCGYILGQGFVRVDLPVGHPHFGRLARCECNRG